MIELRPYQRQALDALYGWYTPDHKGNPCIEAPTGAGKTVLIAQFCKENLDRFPSMKILVVTHVKELIEQDYGKLLEIWPDAPCGIYSASINRRDTEDSIIFCGVQSIRNRTYEFGKVDVMIVDEAHLISHADTGSYRKIIKELSEVNPRLSVIGFTATPYRLGHGMITEGDAIFSEPLIKTIGIEGLQRDGFLAYLRSKVTRAQMDVSEVAYDPKKHDYVEKDLQAKIDTPLLNAQVVDETLRLAQGRRHILFFCCGVDHARHVAEAIREKGETADYLVGSDDKRTREEKLARFRNGEIRCMTNVNVLSTGFDFPDIDCLVMMRPTMSPGLYIQQAGRGLRPKTFGGDCLVLDFAGNVAMHGPITHVNPPKARGARAGKGVPMSKLCPKCDEIVAVQARVCPCCGYEWPKDEKPRTFILHDDDIQGLDRKRFFTVDTWQWRKTISRKGNEMIEVNMYGKRIQDGCITDFFLIFQPGEWGARQRTRLMFLMLHYGILENPKTDEDWNHVLSVLTNVCPPPAMVEFEQDGKYKRVKNYIWKRPDNAEIQKA